MSGPQYYIIAAMGLVKNKLFASDKQGDNSPSKKDNQKDNELFD